MNSDAEVTQLEDRDALDEIAISAEEASQRPVVRLVDLILSEGILSRASDIHIEPEEGGVAVRYRIDGVLRQVMKIPRAAGLPLISRGKIISSLDISDRRPPGPGPGAAWCCPSPPWVSTRTKGRRSSPCWTAATASSWSPGPRARARPPRCTPRCGTCRARA